MKKSIVFLLVSVLSGFFLIACQRGTTVHAGREENPSDYQPAPAPKGEVMPPSQAGTQAMTGELMRVDRAKKTISIRAENGMEQTFKYSDQTTVVGIQSPRAKSNQVQDLIGKEGSEVRILWRDDNGAKTAINVNVT